MAERTDKNGRGRYTFDDKPEKPKVAFIREPDTCWISEVPPENLSTQRTIAVLMSFLCNLTHEQGEWVGKWSG